MSINDSFVKVYEFLLENAPETARDVFEGLEMFKTGLECGYDAISKLIRENSNDFSRVMTISEYGKTLDSLQREVSDYLAEFSMKVSVDDEDSEDDQLADENEDDKSVNYADYRVNSEIPHTLSESFMHKKICGFMLNNIRYEVGTWKDALIKISEILYNEDKTLFTSFLESPAFCGRKNRYFSKISYGNPYYIKMSNVNIYIWTNHSATSICKIIKTMLLCYRKPVNSLYIYLRADYTQLHLGEEADKSAASADNNMKIGKYVRQTMGNLSASKFCFTPDMIAKLTNGEETKKLFGIGIPFLKEYINNGDISVEWIGEIPCDWSIAPLKRIATIQTGSTPSKTDESILYSNEIGLPWIKAENLGSNYPIIKTKEYLTDDGSKIGRTFAQNTVYVCCIASVGKVGYSTIPASCNQQINALSFKNFYWKYGYYMTCSQDTEYQLNASGNVMKIRNSQMQ